MYNLFLGGIVLLVSAGLGRRLAHFIKVPFASGLEELVFAAGLGFGTLAYIILALGLLGLLYPEAAYVLLVLLGLTLFVDIKAIAAIGIRLVRSVLYNFSRRNRGLSKISEIGLLGLGVAFLLL